MKRFSSVAPALHKESRTEILETTALIHRPISPCQELRNQVYKAIVAATDISYRTCEVELQLKPYAARASLTEKPDYSISTFIAARALSVSPVELAAIICQILQKLKIFTNVSAVGPYVNLRLTDTFLEAQLTRLIEGGRTYGHTSGHAGEIAVVDYGCFSTGYQNSLIERGMLVRATSLTRILSAVGYEVVADLRTHDYGKAAAEYLLDHTSGTISPLLKAGIAELNGPVQPARKVRQTISQLRLTGSPENATLQSARDEWFRHTRETCEALQLSAPSVRADSKLADAAVEVIQRYAKKFPEVLQQDDASQAVYISEKTAIPLIAHDGVLTETGYDIASLLTRCQDLQPDLLIYMRADADNLSQQVLESILRAETDDTAVKVRRYRIKTGSTAATDSLSVGLPQRDVALKLLEFQDIVQASAEQCDIEPLERYFDTLESCDHDMPELLCSAYDVVLGNACFLLASQRT